MKKSVSIIVSAALLTVGLVVCPDKTEVTPPAEVVTTELILNVVSRQTRTTGHSWQTASAAKIQIVSKQDLFPTHLSPGAKDLQRSRK